MPSGLIERLRFTGATKLLAAVAIAATTPTAVAAPQLLTGALPPGRASCHARAFDAAELAAHPDRAVTAISLERVASDLAAERKWGALEQFDGTPEVSATLRVRLRGDPVTHSARLECSEDDPGLLVCTNPACAGGEIRIGNEGHGTIAISIGGSLKSGRFIGHYIHLDGSCEGHAGGPIVLESGDDDHSFSLAPAPKEACR